MKDVTNWFGSDVHHKTLGIVGMGRIGMALAQRAHFGIYLGFHEAIKGIILNLLSRIIDTKKINSRMLTLAICAFIVITLTIWVSFRVSVLVFFQLGSPLYGIVSCLIPFFLIYKVAQLEKLRGFKAWLILLYGILLCLSPLLKLIE